MYRTKSTKDNLCSTCGSHIPDCQPNDLVFGDGVGNDNVIACELYNGPIGEEIAVSEPFGKP